MRYFKICWCVLLLLSACASQPATNPTTPSNPVTPTSTSMLTPTNQTRNTPTSFDQNRDPLQIVSSYYNAINRQEYDRAYTYWRTVPDNVDQATFAQGFADTQFVQVLLGIPPRLDAGAGNLYSPVATLIMSQKHDGKIELFQGCYVTHARNEANRAWQLDQATIAPVNTFAATTLIQPKQLCPQYDPNLAFNSQTTSAIDTLGLYADRLRQQNYAEAYQLWQTPNNVTLEQFTQSFTNLSAIQVYAGMPHGDQIPVLVLRQNSDAVQALSGCYTLHNNAGNWQISAETLQPLDLATNSQQLLNQTCQ